MSYVSTAPKPELKSALEAALEQVEFFDPQRFVENTLHSTSEEIEKTFTPLYEQTLLESYNEKTKTFDPETALFALWMHGIAMGMALSGVKIESPPFLTH